MKFGDSTSQTFLLLATVLPEAIIETMLAPLVPFMIRFLSADIPADKLESEIGGRAGLVTAAFYFPLLLMNVLWGTLSDTVGCKPILLLGLFFCGLTTFVLGINTTSFAVALLCRFVAGVFGSNSTVCKGALGVLHTNERGRSWAYSMYNALYAFSGIMGPVIGGLLVTDVRNDSKKSSFPYWQPCLFGAALSCLGFAVALAYFAEPRETARKAIASEIEMNEMDENESKRAEARANPPMSVREVFTIKGILKLFSNLMEPMTKESMVPILLYVLIAFCNMSWVTVLPLLFAADPSMGGTGFSPFDASFAMTCSAVAELAVQALFARNIVLRFGQSKAYCVGIVVVIPATIVMSLVTGRSGTMTWWIVMVCMTLFGFINAVAFLSVIIMISDSVPPASLGAAHGLAATCAAVVRTFAPPLSGIAWSFASTRAKVPGIAFIFTQLGAIVAIVIASNMPKKSQVYRSVRYEEVFIEESEISTVDPSM